MGIEEGEIPAVQSDTLPKPIAEHEARIEHGYGRFCARDKGSVDINQDAVVPFISHKILGSQNILPWRLADC